MARAFNDAQGGFEDHHRPARSTGRAAKEQPAPAQQEPVAYWIPKAEQFCIADPSGRPFAKAWEPLYTTPQPAQRTWVGLTDEEITDIWAESTPYYHEDDFAQAIEAKLKEKNNG